jgi:hypothetical protein
MATSQRSSSGRQSRSGSASNGAKRASSSSSSGARTRARSGAGGASGARRATAAAPSPSLPAEGVGGAARTAMKAAAPLATAVLGAAAGVVLGRNGRSRRRKVLGVTVPGQGDGLQTLGKGMGEAGKQLGRLASEVRAAREKAEEIGKALK